VALEDVKARIAAEQKAQTEAEEKSKAEAARIKAAQDKRISELKAEEKTKKDATRLEKERKELESVIKRLASGEFEESSRAYQTILGQAVQLDTSIKNLEKRLKISQAGKPQMVGELPAQRAPFGGKDAVSKVSTEEVPIVTKEKKKKVVTEPTQKVEKTPKPKEVPTPETAPTAVEELPIERIYELVKTKYKNIDSIFLYNDELGDLLREAVGNIDDPNDDMTAAEFERRLGQTDWALSGSETWRNRSAEKRQYSDLLGKYENQLRLAATETERGKIQEKIDSLKKNSEYGRGVASAKAAILRIASGLIGTPSPEVLDALATEIYDAGIEEDANQIRDKVLSRFSYKTGSIIGGTAGTNLNDLRKTAAANGIELDEIYGDKVQDWLKRIAQGESIETFKSLIRDRAAIGLPDKVANLIRQGLDLEDVYDPYRKIMASVLELQPDSIKLSDPTLTSAFGPNGELPLFEFKRMLRKDPRWQYTDNAREDVSTAALQVLRDFGFQG
jgi:hypothetical protein